MSNHIVFKDCDDAEKSRIGTYWQKKRPRLEKLLTHYRPDIREIRLTVYAHQQSPQRRWFELRSVVHLPTGTLAAEANQKDPCAALDEVVDAMTQEIKRHTEHVRKDYFFKRKNGRRAEISAAGPLPRRDSETPESIDEGPP